MSPPHLQHNSNKSEAEAQVQNRHRLLSFNSAHSLYSDASARQVPTRPSFQIT